MVLSLAARSGKLAGEDRLESRVRLAPSDWKAALSA